MNKKYENKLIYILKLHMINENYDWIDEDGAILTVHETKEGLIEYFEQICTLEYEFKEIYNKYPSVYKHVEKWQRFEIDTMELMK